jgi:hypothetical protein
MPLKLLLEVMVGGTTTVGLFQKIYNNLLYATNIVDSSLINSIEAFINIYDGRKV